MSFKCYIIWNITVILKCSLSFTVFNSRRIHSYSVALPKRFKEQADDTCSISESEISMLSGATGEFPFAIFFLAFLRNSIHNLFLIFQFQLKLCWILGVEPNLLLAMTMVKIFRVVEVVISVEVVTSLEIGS